jgi:hypothetical protein
MNQLHDHESVQRNTVTIHHDGRVSCLLTTDSDNFEVTLVDHQGYNVSEVGSRVDHEIRFNWSNGNKDVFWWRREECIKRLVQSAESQRMLFNLAKELCPSRPPEEDWDAEDSGGNIEQMLEDIGRGESPDVA